MKGSGRPTGRYLLLGLLLLGTAAYQARISFEIVRTLGGPVDVRGPVTLEALGPHITRVQPEAEAAGLRPGDRLLAVNGQPARGVSPLARALARSRPGDVILSPPRGTG